MKALFGAVSLGLLASVLMATSSHLTVRAAGPTLYVDPAASTVSIDDTFTITIYVQDVTDLFSYETKLGFNNTILEPLTVMEGPFIKEQTPSPQGTFFLTSFEDDFVHVACLTLGNYAGVSGSGPLYDVTFAVIGTGASDLHLYDSILLDSSVTRIPHDTVDGTMVATLSGDINNDGIVNVVDLTIVSLAYGTFEGEPGYNPDADLTQDGLVDMRDLVIVARNLGKSVP